MRIILLAIFLLYAEISVGAPLIYWCATNLEEIELAKRLVKEWNHSHSETPIQLQPVPAGASSEEVLLAAIVAKTNPDIYSNMLPAMLNKFVKADSLLRLDGLKNFATETEARIGATILKDYRSPDGHYHQLPWKLNPVMLVYNSDLFQKLKIKPPRTYGEFWTAAKKLTADTDGDGRIDRWAMSPSTTVLWWQRLYDFLPFYMAATNGRSLLNQGRADFNNVSGIAVMDFFQKGFGRGYFPISGTVSNLFVQQKVGMTIVGPWALKMFERSMPQKFNFKTIPIPVPDGHTGPAYTYGDPKSFVVFKNTQHPEAAWEFVKFMTSKKADKLLLDITGQIPVRKELINDSYYKEIFVRRKDLIPFASQVPFTKPGDNSEHIVEILDFLGQQYEAAAVYGTIPAIKAIENAANHVEHIYRNW